MNVDETSLNLGAPRFRCRSRENTAFCLSSGDEHRDARHQWAVMIQKVELEVHGAVDRRNYGHAGGDESCLTPSDHTQNRLKIVERIHCEDHRPRNLWERCTIVALATRSVGDNHAKT